MKDWPRVQAKRRKQGERLKRAYIDVLVNAAEVSIVRGNFDGGLRLCEQAIFYPIIVFIIIFSNRSS